MVLHIDCLTVCSYGVFLGVDAWTDTPVAYPLIVKRDWHVTEISDIYLTPMKNYPLTAAPTGDHQCPETFQTTELPEAFPIPKQYLQDSVVFLS